MERINKIKIGKYPHNFASITIIYIYRVKSQHPRSDKRHLNIPKSCLRIVDGRSMGLTCTTENDVNDLLDAIHEI